MIKPQSFMIHLSSPASEMTVNLPFGRYNNDVVIRRVFAYAGETDTGLQVKVNIKRSGVQYLHTVIDAALDIDGATAETYIYIGSEDRAALVIEGASAHASLDIMIHYEEYDYAGNLDGGQLRTRIVNPSPNP